MPGAILETRQASYLSICARRIYRFGSKDLMIDGFILA